MKALFSTMNYLQLNIWQNIGVASIRWLVQYIYVGFFTMLCNSIPLINCRISSSLVLDHKMFWSLVYLLILVTGMFTNSLPVNWSAYYSITFPGSIGVRTVGIPVKLNLGRDGNNGWYVSIFCHFLALETLIFEWFSSSVV